MARQEHTKKRRAPFGMPKGVVTSRDAGRLAPQCLTEEGGTLCGRLTGLPPDSDPAEARATVTAMVVELAHDVNEAGVDVVWDQPREPGSWTA
ncbi:hypothetical protein AMK23_08360 [Streptomyces sp. CB02130]|uniref:hypothetical protein n=1 Tax=Streptomyces sp. CB02130 TaxID=1703934 RepID=UPI0009402791|nr:hypothetical protein [Streptomyces sp. CB02130]OKJ28410.1 hypothetical protein AMK23_08360 [Streptomyces sp. CB02130]